MGFTKGRKQAAKGLTKGEKKSRHSMSGATPATVAAAAATTTTTATMTSTAAAAADNLATGGDFGNAAWMKNMKKEGVIAPDTADIETAVDLDEGNDDDEEVEVVKDEEGTVDEMEAEEEEAEDDEEDE